MSIKCNLAPCYLVNVRLSGVSDFLFIPLQKRNISRPKNIDNRKCDKEEEELKLFHKTEMKAGIYVLYNKMEIVNPIKFLCC